MAAVLVSSLTSSFGTIETSRRVGSFGVGKARSGGRRQLCDVELIGKASVQNTGFF